MTATQYTHGHDVPVLQAHGLRTAENSAAYLLDRLHPGLSLLDVGCGPGSVTLDLADQVAPGRVVGLDQAETALHAAQERAASRPDTAVEFVAGSVYELPYADGSFDVVHAHQVLQHLTDPVAALREMARVAGPDGIVAAREVDYATMTWWPVSPGIALWLDVYRAMARRNGAEPDAGRQMLSWAQAAGLTDVAVTTSSWTFATPEARTWWADSWITRIGTVTFREQIVAAGMGEHDLDLMRAAWATWRDAPDGYFSMLHTEILAG